MKGIRIVFLLFFIVLVSILSVKGGNPPHPGVSSAKSSTTAVDDDCDPCIPAPPEDELPINNNVVFLLVTALVLGTVVVYKNKIKKASM
ncbi:hypothetical protein L0669_03300 [Flavobacterium bizetiae]|uniref:hypothetical protein n=1 Tax=Flavobacterium bizetiae TaxID=2704140 RepID=UPI0021E92228|nr:hypothetical protein [Flavobacterium bizetiae]UTN04932.1 hypothetical protein L0669_03300 [Flavobacterium bizetiae]